MKKSRSSTGPQMTSAGSMGRSAGTMFGKRCRRTACGAILVGCALLLSAFAPGITATAHGSPVAFSGGSLVTEPSSTVLLQEDFNDGIADGWTISPQGWAAGWGVTTGAYTFDGGGHTQSWRGDAGWSDYTFEAQVRLAALSDFPGGLRARVNPATGECYAVWLYPANGQLKLFRVTGWDIDSPGRVNLGTGTVAGGFEAGMLHTVKIGVVGSTIAVYYDGVQVISAEDAAYATGAIALDVSNQPVAFDNVLVQSALVVPNPTPVLLADDFADGNLDGWTVSPLGGGVGWIVNGGTLFYDGAMASQLYRGGDWWSDYTFEAQVRLASLDNFPGGIRARVDPSTGAGYAVWLYPQYGQIRLWSTSGWDIDSPGLALLGAASGVGFEAGVDHTVGIALSGTSLAVLYDGVTVISATDGAHATGVIALDGSNQPVAFDNVLVQSESAVSNPVPVLTSLFPAAATAGSAAFTLAAYGSSFAPDSLVRWNGSDRVTTLISATQLTASITAADIAIAGTVPVTIYTPAPGGGTSEILNFTVNPPPPTIGAITPASGPAGGGTAVVITGAGFVSGNTVKIGGANATGVVVSSATSISAVTPAGAAGAADVVVTNANGTGTLPGGFTYLVSPLTTVTFDNPSPRGKSGNQLDGVFQGLDFGAKQWRWESARLPDKTNHIYFKSSSGSSRTFTFSPAPRLLISIKAMAGRNSTVTLTDNLGQTAAKAIAAGSMQTVTTGWTRASTTIRVEFTSTKDEGIDDITFRAP